ncbi:MAG: hypothetical protein ACXU8A_06045 [Burkholderiaceae bacterium]
MNVALTVSKDAMSTEMQEAAKSTAAAVRTEIDMALVAVAGQIRDAHHISVFNVVAACISLLAAGVALRVVVR